MSNPPAILVHLGAGVGNVVLATPLLAALDRLGFEVDVALTADYPETADLLRPWSAVRRVFHNDEAPDLTAYTHIVPTIPPFYWPRCAHRYVNDGRALRRPSDALFYENEQAFYFSFAHALGWAGDIPPAPALPIAPATRADVTAHTLVLGPGCKTGEMATKRWPHFPDLAAHFAYVAVVGTRDDLLEKGGASLAFPEHVRNMAGRLSLRETAEVIASAGAFVGNDSGLSHIAAAVGTPSVMIFGPTPDRTLGRFPPNVRVLRRGLPCEPCWFNARFRACASRIDCLVQVSVHAVVGLLEELGFSETTYKRLESLKTGSC